MIGRPRAAAASAVSAWLLAAAMAAVPATAQSPPPDGDWRTFRTEHFRVTFQADLEPVARHAAAVAERTYAVLREELTSPPARVIDMVVTDHVDISNGSATPFTSNRMTIFARPAVGLPGLAYARDWIELVVAHELVHIFHLDQTGPVGGLVRAIFGRVPFLWPLFPAAGTPGWNVEGLATHYESRLTGAGRVHASYNDMVVRTAALESELPDLEDLSAPNPVWPAGQRSYIYGSSLMRWIAEEYGDEAHEALLDATAGAWLPTFLFMDPVARDALGRSFHAIYGDWRIHALHAARDVRDRLGERGLTATETVVGRGPFASAPRVAPDGRTLSYAAHDFRSEPATRLVDLSTGRITTVAERNQTSMLLGPASWLPDGSGFVLPQIEFRDPYRVYSDLWLVDLEGRERRLTSGARLDQPDVAPDGRRVAAIQSHHGALRLVIHDLDSGETLPLVDVEPGEAWDTPRWSPDGRRIAAARYVDGRIDMVVVDVETGAVRPLTRDAAIDRAPAWTPDGRWLLWSSDRSGIANIVAADPSASRPEVLQVTNVLTGAFQPDVTPDGHTLYMSVYHHDGWHIERMPLDPATWTPAPAPVMDYHEAVLPASTPAAAAPAAAPEVAPEPAVGGEAGPYSSLPTVRPYFWLPVYGVTTGAGTDDRMHFVGVYSMGWDLLRRHDWEAFAAMDVATRRFQGRFGWTWRGLGTPELRLTLARDWDPAGFFPLDGGGAEALLLRQDRVAVDAFFLRQRWRSAAWAWIGADHAADRYEGFTLDSAALAAEGYRLRELPTTAGVYVAPGFSTARRAPFSISLEDGITASASAGRWFDIDDGGRAYDQLRGSLAGYLGFPLAGFANHVLAGRGAGLFRAGDQARATSIGGTPGSLSERTRTDPTTLFTFPVRGYPDGARIGTRAWNASVEYRFPLHLRDAPGNVLGFSLTRISGAAFADAGDAWCPTPGTQPVCSPEAARPLLSAGGEISVEFGIFHSWAILLRGGVGVPLGPVEHDPAFYLTFGPSF